jgi:hypothetical protein
MHGLQLAKVVDMCFSQEFPLPLELYAHLDRNEDSINQQSVPIFLKYGRRYPFQIVGKLLNGKHPKEKHANQKALLLTLEWKKHTSQDEDPLRNTCDLVIEVSPPFVPGHV